MPLISHLQQKNILAQVHGWGIISPADGQTARSSVPRDTPTGVSSSAKVATNTSSTTCSSSVNSLSLVGGQALKGRGSALGHPTSGAVAVTFNNNLTHAGTFSNETDDMAGSRFAGIFDLAASRTPGGDSAGGTCGPLTKTWIIMEYCDRGCLQVRGRAWAWGVFSLWMNGEDCAGNTT